jgi:hypothetical protein
MHRPIASGPPAPPPPGERIPGHAHAIVRQRRVMPRIALTRNQDRGTHSTRTTSPHFGGPVLIQMKIPFASLGVNWRGGCLSAGFFSMWANLTGAAPTDLVSVERMVLHYSHSHARAPPAPTCSAESPAPPTRGRRGPVGLRAASSAESFARPTQGRSGRTPIRFALTTFSCPLPPPARG